MDTNKRSNFLRLSFVVMVAILAVILVQTTTAFAGGIYGKCGKILDDGKDDGYGCYSIEDVSLNSCNVIGCESFDTIGEHGWNPSTRYGKDAISINNKDGYVDFDFGNDTEYVFSDDDGHYDINRLSLVCETVGDYYALVLVYDTDTWNWDITGESFHITGDVVINGQKAIPISNWFEDRSDSLDYDYEFVWIMNKTKFSNYLGSEISMQDAIKSGIVSVDLNELECRSYDQRNNHWVKFDVSHLRLDGTSVKFDGYPAIHDGRTNKVSDGRHYQFSDEVDETYDIYNLNLQAFSYDRSGEENIYITYHTNTPSSDLNGEDFKGSFDIIVDGKVFKSCNFAFADKVDSGEAEDNYLMWTYDTDKFISEVGCSLGEGIANGRIVVQMTSFKCDPC